MKFDTTDKENTNVLEWIDSHSSKCGYWKQIDKLDGIITYCFTPTSKGLQKELRCVCGETGDITDHAD